MRLPILALAVLAAACTSAATRPASPPAASGAGWRAVATKSDRARLRDWRSSWMQALRQARAAGHGVEIDAEGALLAPDAALPGAVLPPGDYRCRTIKVGAQASRRAGGLEYITYPFFACAVGAANGGGVQAFTKRTGSQRQIGWLYPDTGRRMVFIGTLQLGDESAVLRYGKDRQRDLAGMVERVGDQRWRLALPAPYFESLVDVIELVPAA